MKQTRSWGRTGQFWQVEAFDRFIRDHDHYKKTIAYIENNPVKAYLCEKPSSWQFSSAWFRAQKESENGRVVKENTKAIAGSAGMRGPQRGSPAGVLNSPAMSAERNEVERSAKMNVRATGDKGS